MKIEDIVTKVQKHHNGFGWKWSDGGIDAWIDEDRVNVSINYNHKKVSGNLALQTAKTIFGKNVSYEKLTRQYSDEPFICINWKRNPAGAGKKEAKE
jgi:hypothetical protein